MPGSDKSAIWGIIQDVELAPRLIKGYEVSDLDCVIVFYVMLFN